MEPETITITCAVCGQPCTKRGKTRTGSQYYECPNRGCTEFRRSFVPDALKKRPGRKTPRKTNAEYLRESRARKKAKELSASQGTTT